MDTRAIGKRIKTAREQANMTQEGLAAAIGCTPQHISVIERGLKTPKLDTLVAIANTLGVGTDALLRDVLSCAAVADPNALSALTASLPDSLQKRLAHALRVFFEES